MYISIFCVKNSFYSDPVRKRNERKLNSWTSDERGLFGMKGTLKYSQNLCWIFVALHTHNIPTDVFTIWNSLHWSLNMFINLFPTNLILGAYAQKTLFLAAQQKKKQLWLWVVAYSILVSAQGPLVLGSGLKGLGHRGLGPGLDNFAWANSSWGYPPLKKKVCLKWLKMAWNGF